jgi:trimeric autotransporter adhesin
MKQSRTRFVVIAIAAAAIALGLSSCTLLGFLDSISVQVNGTSVSAYDFGNQALYSSSQPVTVTIVNNGLFPLTFGGSSAIALSGNAMSDFSLGGSPGDTIEAGGSVTFTVTFAPSAMGARDAGITITPSGGSGSSSFTLSGTGVSSGSIALSDASYPTISNGANLIEYPATTGITNTVFTITNNGADTLYLSGTPLVSVSGDPSITVTAQPSQAIAAGGTATFTLSIDTTNLTQGNSYPAIITIISSDGASTPFTFTNTYRDWAP